MQTVLFGNRVEQSPKSAFGYGVYSVRATIDSGNLLRWFQANWSPVDGKLFRNTAYSEWSRLDPAYRILLKVCVLPNTQNLDSVIWPRSLGSNIESRCKCIMSYSLIRGPTYLP
jgi:hypothetical protein